MYCVIYVFLITRCEYCSQTVMLCDFICYTLSVIYDKYVKNVKVKIKKSQVILLHF